MVGYRETNLVNWGCFDDPDYVDYSYANMNEWGNKRYITPGVVFGGELITTDLVEINLTIRILLGSSYFDDWTETETPLVTEDPLGNPVDPRHPWNKVTIPKPQKRDFADKYSWVVSPGCTTSATTARRCDTGGGPFARSGDGQGRPVDFGYAKATGHSIQMVLPRTPNAPEMASSPRYLHARAYWAAQPVSLPMGLRLRRRLQLPCDVQYGSHPRTVPRAGRKATRRRIPPTTDCGRPAPWRCVPRTSASILI